MILLPFCYSNTNNPLYARDQAKELSFTKTSEKIHQYQTARD